MKQRGDSLKDDAVDIFLAGVNAVQPGQKIKKHVRLENNRIFVDDRKFPLHDRTNIYVVGSGKASAAMAQALEEILGDRIHSGFIVTKYGHDLPLKKIAVREAGHPVPDENGEKAAEEMVALLSTVGENDIVFFLASGGGSALLALPVPGITLNDKILVTEALLRAGASIREINTVRKHLSAVKGGQLARIAYPATVITLMISDVVGNDPDIIASGPTVPDNSTFADGRAVLNRYNLGSLLPGSVLNRFKRGAAGELEETPKPGDPVFKRSRNILIASNLQAIEAAGSRAEELGYNTHVLSTEMEGDTRTASRIHTKAAAGICQNGRPVPPPACLISGGETTVFIRGNGKGGRNQEFVLAAAIAIDGRENTAVLSGGTDGTDGPTDAAGAFADGTTIRRAAALGMNAGEYLDNNDSYHFFKPLGDLVVTGPTHTNVMDLHVVLVCERWEFPFFCPEYQGIK